MNIRFN